MIRVFALVPLCLLLACSDDGYRIVVTFDNRDIVPFVDRIDIAIVDTCTEQPDGGPAVGPPPSGRPYKSITVTKGQPFEKIGDLEPGVYGIYAVGRYSERNNCVVAVGCEMVVVEAGGKDDLTVELSMIQVPSTCPLVDAGTDAPRCEDQVEECNGEDDDCDDEVDEDFELVSNPLHCGECNNACSGTQACADERCAPPATEISTGGAHTCARREDNAVYCWGLNSSGQLGDGTMSNKNAPVAVMDLEALSVGLGGNHTCAVRTDNHLMCWGANERRQVGDNSTTARTRPVEVPSLNNVIQVGPGVSHTCAVLDTNRVACWGANDRGQVGQTASSFIGPPTLVDGGSAQFTEVHGGAAHTCALAMDSRIYCWGKNDSGQLGDGTTTSRIEPMPVLITKGDPLENVENFVLGTEHACALLENGEVWCWGENAFRMVLDDVTTDQHFAVSTGRDDAEDVSAGSNFSCALLRRDSQGLVECWGTGAVVSRDGDEDPIPVPRLVDAVKLTPTLGNLHTCAQRAQRSLVCWGRNSSGQLGAGLDVLQSVTPVRVKRL